MASTLQSFVEPTSLHGPAEIYNARNSVGRLYWSVIFVALIAIGVYFIYTVVVSYLVAPITTIITVVDLNSMVLPEVAICYMGAIDTVKLLDRGLSIEAVRAVQKQVVYGAHSEDSLSLTEATESFKATKPEILDFMARQNLSGYDGLIEYASYNCSQLIVDYHTFSDKNRRDSCNVLKTIPHFLYGQCYILPSIKQTKSFVIHGWTILLNAPREHDLVQDLHDTLSFVIELAETYDLPTVDSYKLPLNRTVSIALQQIRYNRLTYRQWPRSGTMRCFENENNETYLNCYHYCLTIRILKQCKCLPLNLKKANIGTLNENHYPICWPDFSDNCDNSDNYTSIEIASKADCYCVPLCVETTYGVVISYADFRPEQTIRKFGLTGNTQGVIHVEIGYSALRYTSIEEQDTAGLDGCVSNIGGMFGLWLGGSVFTIIHLLTALCQNARTCFK